MAVPSHKASVVTPQVLRGILREINPGIGIDWRVAELLSHALDTYAARILGQEHAIAIGSLANPDFRDGGGQPVAPAVELLNAQNIMNLQVNSLHVAEPSSLGLIEQQLQLFGPIKHDLFSQTS